jgi:hypothetical protein
VHLAVRMPRLPAARGQARTQARIGRKVAALFGVAGDHVDGDAGAGRAWLSSYGELTMNELLLGGPQRMKKVPPWVHDTGVFEPSVHGRRTKPAEGGANSRRGLGEIDDAAISPALIRGYGPDPKAAVTLVGVNHVLEPLTDALITVLTEMDFPDERLLVGTTAMLLSEAFRSQPLLTLAGVQASRIQRAYRLEDLVAVAADAPSQDRPWRASRSDLSLRRLNEQSAESTMDLLAPGVTPLTGEASGPRAAPVENPLQPYRLKLLDDVWDALTRSATAPGLDTPPARLVPIAAQSSRARQRWDAAQVIFTRERALAVLTTWVESIVFGLGDGVAGTRIVLRTMEDGRFTADFPGVATRPARVLADNVLGHYFREPADAPAPTDVGPSPVPAFDPERWRYEPELVRRAALWAHHCAERFVSSGAWSELQSHNKNLANRVEQRGLLADTSAEMLGSDDPLTVELRLFAARFRMERDRKLYTVAATAEQRPDLVETVRAFEYSIEHLRALNKREQLADSHFVESLQSTLAELLRIKPLVPGELGRRIGGMLERYWLAYLRVQLRLVGGTAFGEWPEILHELAADGAWRHPVYATILESSPNLGLAVAEFEVPDALELALRIQENTRLRRRELFLRENVWPLYRDTLVDKAKLLLRLWAENAEDDDAAQALLSLTDELFERELGEEWRSAPAILQRNWERLAVSDALLLQVMEYLRVSQGHELDQQGIGLRQEVLAELRRYRSWIDERLGREPWTGRLAEYRSVIVEALDSRPTEIEV